MKNVLLYQFLFRSRQIKFLHFMLQNIPSLFPIRFVFLLLLILRFNIGFGRFSSVFHSLCDLSSLSTSCVLSCSSTRSCICLPSASSWSCCSFLRVPRRSVLLWSLLLLLDLGLLRSTWLKRLLALSVDLLLPTSII